MEPHQGHRNARNPRAFRVPGGERGLEEGDAGERRWDGRRERGGGGRRGRPTDAYRQRPDVRAVHPIGYPALLEKLTLEPVDLLMSLCGDRCPVRPHLLNANLQMERPGFADLILHVLCRALSCPSAPIARNQLLSFLLTSEFFTRVIHRRLLAGHHGNRADTWAAMENYLIIAEGMVTTLEDGWYCVQPVLLELRQQMDDWSAGGWTAPREGAMLVDRVFDAVKAARERSAALERRAAQAAAGISGGPPPEDFRELSIFPTAEDLRVVKPYLRANKVEGGYEDCEHYLDVQFRLLRQDFMSPLRTGVLKYLEQIRLGQGASRLQDIRVYLGVVILGAVASQSGLTYRIRFDISKMKNKRRLMASKRLVFGSLLCLSSDNFETIYVATVQEKNDKDIVRGELQVIFEGPSAAAIQAVDYSTMEFKMVETSAYFEAYRHVLEGLQEIKPERLPFQGYIVKCNCTDYHPPEYLKQMMFSYDMSCICPAEASPASQIKLRRVNVQPHAQWPSEDDFGLDASQLQALKLALTSQFAVIQGPPGTGKTFIGLKIVKLLLANLYSEVLAAQLNFLTLLSGHQKPVRTADSPILVVCYTNHALDQFLEGILEYAPGGVVRVGSRSASEKLQQCAIAKQRDHSLISQALRRQYAEVRRRIQEKHNLTIDIARRIAISDVGILNYSVIDGFIQDRHSWQLRPRVDRFSTNSYSQNLLTAWLGLVPLPDGHADATGQGKLSEGDQRVGIVLDQAAATVGAGMDDEESSDEEDLLDEESAFEVRHRKLEDSDDDHEGVSALDLRQIEASDVAVNFQQMAADAKAQASKRISNTAMRGPANNDGEWQVVGAKASAKKLLKRLRCTKPMTQEEEEAVNNIWALAAPKRWRLYMTWVHRYRKSLSDRLVEECRGHNELVKELTEIKMQGDIRILKNAKVVGMTTTGAARYRNVLQQVRPRIIVVEEAAEVLEAHVVATLSPSCEHLILIGDHMQLRPNPTVFELAKTYNLDVSLFERMIKNNLPFRTLSTQHRMRPEISYVMRHIYKDLLDHDSVKNFENINGMKHNVFYATHSEPEETDDVLSSHSNRHEAEMIVALSRYLLQQGYEPKQITILSPYTGQLMLLRRLMRESGRSDEKLRITSIDNYQGEENDIILLSMVRSNSEGRVGFINVSNRICVALSRAKKGLYVFGNFAMLAEAKHSDLWQKITADMLGRGQLGKELPLVCRMHSTETKVTCAQDFTKVPEGGCTRICEIRLDCGHACDRVCHPIESDHDDVQCQKPCSKQFQNCGHMCRRVCSADCGSCPTLVRHRMRCGHTEEMMCGVDVMAHSCRSPCPRTLDCGHPCSNPCGDPCSSLCQVAESRTYSCGHKNAVLCHQSEETAPCQNLCGTVLKCGHLCSGTCGQCRHGRLHKPCSEPCKRVLVCGHECKGMCCNGCPPCTEPCENRCPHSKCRKRCGDQCVPCREPCLWRCQHHQCSRLCSEPCNRPRCDEPCTKVVRCRRCRSQVQCIGLCGEPCPVVCDTCDPSKPYREVFLGGEADDDARFLQLEDCGHVIESVGTDYWMDSAAAAGGEQAEARRGSSGSTSIQLKQCPRCKTPIRRCMRYGVLVNAQLDDIERVKSRVRGDCAEIGRAFDSTQREAKALGFRELLVPMTSTALRNITAGQVEVLQFQLQCLKKIDHLSSTEPSLRRDFDELKSFVLSLAGALRAQEIEDVQDELLLLSYRVTLEAAKKFYAPGGTSSELARVLPRAAIILGGRGRLNARKKEELQLILPVLRKYSGVTREEKDMVMTAMGFAQKGHWYKCPKGHIYCIGECGGATVESKCPECGNAIGGTSHRLRDDNAVATEMDGATQPAFSEAYNLPPHFLH